MHTRYGIFFFSHFCEDNTRRVPSHGAPIPQDILFGDREDSPCKVPSGMCHPRASKPVRSAKTMYAPTRSYALFRSQRMTQTVWTMAQYCARPVSRRHRWRRNARVAHAPTSSSNAIASRKAERRARPAREGASTIKLHAYIGRPPSSPSCPLSTRGSPVRRVM